MTGHDRRLATLEVRWPMPPPPWATRAARRVLAGADEVFINIYAEKLARDAPDLPDMRHLTDRVLAVLAAELAPELGYPVDEVLADLQSMRNRP